jgi:hypothetical protein
VQDSPLTGAVNRSDRDEGMTMNGFVPLLEAVNNHTLALYRRPALTSTAHR